MKYSKGSKDSPFTLWFDTDLDERALLKMYELLIAERTSA